MLTEPISVVLEVAQILEGLNIPYYVGGSLASAVHGMARATMDVDLIVELNVNHVNDIVTSLDKSFFVDEEMILNAIQNKQSFNILHKDTMFKVDIFPHKGRPFDDSQFARRSQYQLSSSDKRKVYVSSAEDHILAKLEWYRMGGETSDRQWQDVANVIRIQGDDLDIKYLRKWAEELEVDDLLERALKEWRTQ